MSNASSFWKRFLVLAGAIVLTLGRLWHTASSSILPQQAAQKALSSVSSGDSEEGLATGSKQGRHQRSLGLYPCEPAQTQGSSLDHDKLNRFILLSYAVSPSTPGYEALPKGSSAKMLLVQGSCDGGDGGGSDGSSDSNDATDTSDATDYDDTGDSSDDA